MELCAPHLGHGVEELRQRVFEEKEQRGRGLRWVSEGECFRISKKVLASALLTLKRPPGFS